MTSRTYRAVLNGEEISASSEDLCKFAGFFIYDSDLRGRISDLFLFDLYVLSRVFGVSPPEVLQSVHALEAGEVSSGGVKPATQFRKPPLKGLWHKHYFSAHFLVNNILLGLGKGGLKKLIDEVMDPAKSPIVTEEMISELAHRVAHEPYEKRYDDGKITGEWIIFLKREGRNYYLCLNTHGAGDEFIYERIVDLASKTFPDVKTWIEEAAST